MEVTTINHFYAFRIKEGERIPIFERTFGTKKAAMAWVEKQQGFAFFTINCLPKDFFR